MKKLILIRAAISLVAFPAAAGCGFTEYKTLPTGTYPIGSSPTASASYQQISSQILQPLCVRCHSNFSSYSGLKSDSTAVNPGNPQGSALYTEVATGSMPKGGNSLAPEQVALVYQWIQEGAQNN